MKIRQPIRQSSEELIQINGLLVMVGASHIRQITRYGLETPLR